MATKSTKVTKGSLKSASGGKSTKVSAKAQPTRTVLTDAKAYKGAAGGGPVSGRFSKEDKAVDSKKKLLGASAKAINAAGGIECDPKYQHNLGSSSGNIKVKVGGANLNAAASGKGKGK